MYPDEIMVVTRPYACLMLFISISLYMYLRFFTLADTLI